MTPAIRLLQNKKIPFQVHEYRHDPASDSYGLEAAEKLQVSPESVFKTLVVNLDGRALAVAILPVARNLSMKQIAKAAGAKKASLAPAAEVERATGYVLGGVSPLGQKKRLLSVIDASAQTCTTIFVSAGRRGLEVELHPDDLGSTIDAKFAPLSQ